MRVFFRPPKTTSSALYVKAIDDAVALGADAINMSLGSSTGSMVDAGSDIVDAIKRARAKGVSVLISAGNSNTFGNGYSKPLAETQTMAWLEIHPLLKTQFQLLLSTIKH